MDWTEFRRRILEMPDDEIAMLAREITDALEGDSNDAEHDALVSCAEAFGLKYGPEIWEAE